MPRFFFHLHNDFDVPDEEGRDFPDFGAAMDYARRITLDEASEHLREQGRIVLDHHIDVEDEQQAVLATVHFRDVVTIQS